MLPNFKKGGKPTGFPPFLEFHKLNSSIYYTKLLSFFFLNMALQSVQSGSLFLCHGGQVPVAGKEEDLAAVFPGIFLQETKPLFCSCIVILGKDVIQKQRQFLFFPAYQTGNSQT